MDRQNRTWGFLTNHTHVLVALARNPGLRLREIAAACHITDRTAQSIITDLEHAGYLTRERDGRRRRYGLQLDGTPRHPAEAHLPLTKVLGLLTGG